MSMVGEALEVIGKSDCANWTGNGSSKSQRMLQTCSRFVFILKVEFYTIKGSSILDKWSDRPASKRTKANISTKWRHNGSRENT